MTAALYPKQNPGKLLETERVNSVCRKHNGTLQWQQNRPRLEEVLSQPTDKLCHKQRKY